MKFIEWLRSIGCAVEVIQEDDGSGYMVLEIMNPAGEHFNVTITG